MVFNLFFWSYNSFNNNNYNKIGSEIKVISLRKGLRSFAVFVSRIYCMMITTCEQLNNVYYEYQLNIVYYEYQLNNVYYEYFE